MPPALSAQLRGSLQSVGCVTSTGQQLSAGSLRFGVRVAWREKRYRSPSSCLIFHLITLVSVAEPGPGGKAPRKEPGKH